MTTHRERKEARAERLRAWAEKREAKSAAAFGQAQQIGDAIPFGQPILVGRHRWAIRARRAEGNIRRALDMLDSFDPTSGPARARVLVSDLRSCLDAVNDA